MQAKPRNNAFRYCQSFLLPLALLFVAYLGAGMAQTNPEAAKAGSQTATAEHDGSHDFDFFVGTWKFHLKRRLRPLTGSNTWVDFEGIDVDRNILNGKVNIDELAVDGPTGHVEGITLRLSIPNHTSGVFIGRMARPESSVGRPTSANSRMDAASFIARTLTTAE